ncbi:MAG: hypothetical protein F4Y31_11505 [Gammaproteobacteria bacterium]|nr:hypothetical protein [Gammaproteobacteria bacterium]MYF66522.1 hypothetical protein [Gammaproteobacteria bacterium]MYK37166.1 hypothetical protein [Gammaproteobacteria bacterium]
MSKSLEPPDGPTDAAELRSRLLECLGGDWPEPCELEPKVTREEQLNGYRLLWVDYAVESGHRVPAILMIPDGVTPASPAAGVAVWHQHAGKWHLGKSEPAGLAGDPMHHTGVALVQLGYVVLCPDALCFEDRRDPQGRFEGGDFERFEFLRHVVQGRCMAWKNILDMRRAVDYLSTRPEVDAGRLGCYGHSMGSIHTWLVGPWEQRLKCLVGNCCLPTYSAIDRHKLLNCFPAFIPGFHQYGDTPDIVGLIAPRALHLNFGENDAGSPIEDVHRSLERISRAYAGAGAGERFTWLIEPGAGHILSAKMWRKVRETLRKHLS